MKKYIVILILVLTGLINAEGANSEKNKLEKIRGLYYSAVENEDDIKKLKQTIRQYYGEDASEYPPLILAYAGGIESLKAKHAFWPFNKMSHLNDGMDILKRAVFKDPENLEIRFMRFSILHYVPGILGYGSERENDKEAIIKLLSQKKYGSLDIDVVKGVAEFMIDSGRLTSVEVKELEDRFKPVLANE